VLYRSTTRFDISTEGYPVSCFVVLASGSKATGSDGKSGSVVERLGVSLLFISLRDESPDIVVFVSSTVPYLVAFSHFPAEFPSLEVDT